MSEAHVPSPHAWDRVAEAVSSLFNPLMSITLVALGIALAHPAWRAADLALWAGLALIPGLLLVFGLRRGFWTDMDLGQLKERRTFLPWASLSSVALAVSFFLVRVPAGLRFAAAAVALWLTASSVVSTVWKISLHEGSALGAWVLCFVLVGRPLALALVWVPPLVAWARLRLHRHTPAQLAAGAVCAALAALVAARFTLS